MLLGPTIIDAGDKRLAAIQLFDANGDPVVSLSGTPPSDATLTNVGGVTTSVVLQAANPNRRALIIYNDAPKNLRVAFAATASATSFTHFVASKQAVEIPLGGYTGVVSGIWEGAGGFARVTEVTTT